MVKRVALALSLVSFATTAHAHARHHYNHRHHHRHLASEPASPAAHGGNNAAAARARGLPWCGAYMADLFHYVGAKARELWVAAAWAREGHATVPHIGAVVVWRHHVGKIVGREHGIWVILSGNDGHSVRARARSIAGAIAIRDI